MEREAPQLSSSKRKMSLLMMSSSLVWPMGTVVISASQPSPELMTVGSMGVTISVTIPARVLRYRLSLMNLRWLRRNSSRSAGGISPLRAHTRLAQKSSRFF